MMKVVVVLVHLLKVGVLLVLNAVVLAGSDECCYWCLQCFVVRPVFVPLTALSYVHVTYTHVSKTYINYMLYI